MASILSSKLADSLLTFCLLTEVYTNVAQKANKNYFKISKKLTDPFDEGALHFWRGMNNLFLSKFLISMKNTVQQQQSTFWSD